MKILFVLLGNPETDRRSLNMVRFFYEAGWTVELIAGVPVDTNVLSAHSLALGLTAHRGPRRFWQYHRKLQALLRDTTTDIVVACDLYGLRAASWMKRTGRAKYLVYDAREIYTKLPTVEHHTVRRAVWTFVERHALRDTNLVLVTATRDTQALFAVHRRLPRTKLVRNLPWIEPAIAPDRARIAALGLGGSERIPIFVYLGGLQEGRALRQTIEAMRGLPARLLLIGDGVLRNALENRVKLLKLEDRVKFAGSLEATTALELVACCDIGLAIIEPISESYRLALPSKLFEYMMAGLPVVSSELLQVRELVGNAPWLQYVPSCSVDDITATMQEALLLAKDQQRGEAARKRALADFHFGVDGAALEAMLRLQIATA